MSDPSSRPQGVDATIAQVIAIASARASACGRTCVVLIDGPSGSGKTDFARRLAAELRPTPQIVHMDEIYPGWAGLAASVPLLHDDVLVPLSSGRDGSYRRYDWVRQQPGNVVPVPVADWLIVEGAGCGSRAPAAHAVALLWLDADPAVRRRRALARDGDTYAPHWERWAWQERVLFAAEQTAARADLVRDTGR